MHHTLCARSVLRVLKAYCGKKPTYKCKLTSRNPRLFITILLRSTILLNTAKLRLLSIEHTGSIPLKARLKCGVGLAAVGGARVVDDVALQGARHGVPDVRLCQIH